jgi:hypothetical protein
VICKRAPKPINWSVREGSGSGSRSGDCYPARSSFSRLTVVPGSSRSGTFRSRFASTSSVAIRIAYTPIIITPQVAAMPSLTTGSPFENLSGFLSFPRFRGHVAVSRIEQKRISSRTLLG